MTRTELYEQEIRAELAHLKAELDSLQTEAMRAKLEQESKLDEYLTTLTEKSEAVGKKLDNLKDASSDAADEIRAGLTEAWERLAIAKNAAQAKFH